MIKRLIKTVFAGMGYEIVKIPPIPHVEFARFESLCHAYERDSGKKFSKNSLRSRLCRPARRHRAV